MGFANWLKSFADKVATHYKYFPVLFVVTGLPKQRDSLANLQPSLMRIFRIVKIERLADEEVRDFIKKSFERANMKVEPSRVLKKSLANG